MPALILMRRPSSLNPTSSRQEPRETFFEVLTLMLRFTGLAISHLHLQLARTMYPAHPSGKV